MPPRDWHLLVNGQQFSNVMRLVHLSMRLDFIDERRVRSELTRMRRSAYEQELAIQARRVGCGEQYVLLQNGPVLTALHEASTVDAESIINTYNYDLAKAIQKIRAAVPTANRYVYAKRLAQWEKGRLQWKAPQIAMYTENSARALAQKDFWAENRIQGYAEIEPKTAVCPVCQGWILRGLCPIEVLLNNPPPYHPWCPHTIRTLPERLHESECALLWLGD